MAEQPEIPDLKKKEKERKKGGLLWRGAGGGGAPFSGATGGIARSAASAAQAIAEAAGDAAMEESAGWFSRLAQAVLGPLGRLGATWAGKLALAALAAALIGGAAMVARMMNAGAGAGSAGVGPADGLGAIASSIRIHTGSASGLDYAARANQGALANQALPAAAQKPAAPAKAQAAGQAATADQPVAAPALDNGAIMANQQRLAHNMSGTQLSTSFGGGDFGDHNIFAGGPKVGHFSPGNLSAMLNPAASPGKASNANAVAARAAAMNRGRRGIGMSGSFGHLLTMAGMNRTMLSANTQEGAGQNASDQWQSQQTTGGAAPTTPITGAGATPVGGGGAGGGGGVPSIPGGSGAGSCTNPGEVFDGTSCVPAQTPTGVDVTPWQGMLGSALGMINGAVAMIMMASALFTAMWITSFALKTNPWTYAAGIALEVAAIVFAVAMTGMAMMMGGQIQQLGQSVSSAGSQIIGSGLASLGGLIKSMAWTSITGIGGMILSFMILSKESSVLSQVGQQGSAGATPNPAPAPVSSSLGGP